jgi:hypothetical protein
LRILKKKNAGWKIGLEIKDMGMVEIRINKGKIMEIRKCWATLSNIAIK